MEITKYFDGGDGTGAYLRFGANSWTETESVPVVH